VVCRVWVGGVVQSINMKLLNLTGTTHVPRVLVGNKSDLLPPMVNSSGGVGGAATGELRRQVSVEQGRELARQWDCAFVECSAKKNERIGVSGRPAGYPLHLFIYRSIY
jgi:Ras family protein